MSDLAFNPVQRSIFAASQAAQDYLCVATKTATGVAGHDSMNPVTPGHAMVARYVEDPLTASSRLVGTASSYPSGTLDNFFAIDGERDDVYYNDPRDLQGPTHFPFQYCEKIAPGGLQAMERFSDSFGDYQYDSHNCVDYAVGAFEAATQQSIFGVQRESILDVGSPRGLGAQINALNGVTSTARPALLTFGGGIEGPRQDEHSGSLGATWGDATNTVGDRFGMRYQGPSFEHDSRGFEVGLGSLGLGLDAQTKDGAFGFEASTSMGVSGGIYTGENGRWGLDIPLVGGLVVEHGANDDWSLQTQIGPVDFDFHASGGVLQSWGDSISSAWDSVTSWF